MFPKSKERNYFELNLTKSGQVALDVFHMLRNNAANRVFNEYEEDCLYEQFVPTGTIEGEPATPDELYFISTLVDGDYHKIRVHDVKKYGEEECEMRLVTFVLVSPDHHTTVRIVVRRDYVDSDEFASGWNSWKLSSIRINSAFRFGQSMSKNNFVLRVIHYHRETLCDYGAKRIGGLLRIAKRS